MLPADPHGEIAIAMLEGVGEQRMGDLPHLARVSRHPAFREAFQLEAPALFGGEQLEILHHVGDGGGQIKDRALGHDAALLRPGDQQRLLDDMGEPVQFALELLGQFGGDAVAGLLHLEADDGQGRAQLVGDFRRVGVHLREGRIEPRQQIIQLPEQVAKFQIHFRQGDGFGEVAGVFGLELAVHAGDGAQGLPGEPVAAHHRHQNHRNQIQQRGI